MDNFERELSEKLAEVYRSVTKLEENALKEGNINLTIAEVHLVCILSSYENGKTISEIAALLDVTRPTATVAVNKLVKKGYVEKTVGLKDGRQVTVKLNTDGKKITILHKKCQRDVIKKLGQDFTDDEREILIRAINKLNVFFTNERKINET